MAKNTPHTKSKSAHTTSNIQLLSQLTIVGIVLYVIIDLILTYLRPDYSWLHNAESDYGRGPYFWLMDINFILRGLFSLAIARALSLRFSKNRTVKVVSNWIIVWAIASGLLAFFADNPYGYTRLRSGDVHLLLAFAAFISALVAMIVLARNLSAIGFSLTFARALMGLTVVAILSILLLGHAGIRPHSFGGLYERLFLGSVIFWEGTLAAALLKRQ